MACVFDDMFMLGTKHICKICREEHKKLKVGATLSAGQKFVGQKLSVTFPEFFMYSCTFGSKLALC